MSFINPFFLFALGAAAVPVLFHFVRKMQAKKVPFPSLMFLRATPKELVRRRRLRDLLLLAMRMALFALLALVFARPFLPEESLPFVPQRESQSVVLLVDRSLSMQAGGAFERARQAVLDRLDAAEGADEFAVVAFDDRAQTLTAFSRDRALHRGVVETLAPSFRPTDFYEPFRLAEDLLGEARHDQRTVVLVSDFQQAGFSGALDNWTLPPDVQFVPVSVAEGAPGNAFVDDFAVGTRRVGPEVTVQFDARVAAHGARARQGGTARLVIDGAEVERRPRPAVDAHRLSVQQVAPREGFFQGELVLDEDALAADDRYFFTYAVAARPSVLVIDDAPRGLSDAFFLGNALDLGDDGLYDVSSGGLGRLTRGVLRGFDVVFLANPGALTAAQTSALRDFSEAGGTLVVSFGPAAEAASALPAALGLGASRGVVAARSLQSTEAIIGEVELRHPIFEVFAGAGRGAILRPRFRRYLRLAPDSAATVLGRFDTGDPFLVERRLGAGRVLAYTSSFSTAWTNFPLDEAYVPFVYQLVGYGLRSGEARHQFTVGEAVPLAGRAGDVWDVRTPAGDVFQVEAGADGRGYFRETERPGHYVAAQGSARFPFSVNTDPAESDLQRRDAEEVYAAVVPPSDDAPTTPAQAALAVADEEKEQKLWRLILLLALGLFAAETVLANRPTGAKKQKPGKTI